MKLIISGYGTEPNIGIGEYIVESAGNNRFTGAVWTGFADSPAYVCGGDGFVFAAAEKGDYSVYYIYKDGVLCDSLYLDGCGALCHIAYSRRHKTLYGACYLTGNLRAAQIDAPSGRFTKAQQDYMQGGRAHSVLLNRAEDTLYSANLGHDKIFVYSVTDGGILHLTNEIDTGKGKGVRHIAFSRDESLLYAITEYSNEILVINPTGGKILQVISTLPQNETRRSDCSTLCFSLDYQKLYGANRFTDTIVVFEVDESGFLTSPRWFECGGHIPRHMAVLSDGSLAVCCQESDRVALIDPETGNVTDTLVFFKPSGVIEL